jgi:hypothetical protein
VPERSECALERRRLAAAISATTTTLDAAGGYAPYPDRAPPTVSIDQDRCRPLAHICVIVHCAGHDLAPPPTLSRRLLRTERGEVEGEPIRLRAVACHQRQAAEANVGGQRQAAEAIVGGLPGRIMDLRGLFRTAALVGPSQPIVISVTPQPRSHSLLNDKLIQ